MANIVKELKSFRTAGSKTYLLDDGSYRFESGGHYHHYKQGSGWVETDTKFYASGSNKYISGEFPFPVDFDLSTRTAIIEFEGQTLTISPTLGVRNPTVTSASGIIILAGLWRSVDVKVQLIKNRGLKFTYHKTAGNAPSEIAWQLGGNYSSLLGPIGYDSASGWVDVPYTDSGNGLITIDISAVPIGQEIDPTFAVAAVNDDWHWYPTSTFSRTSTTVTWGSFNASYYWYAGLRFPSVTVPKNATIVNASLAVYCTSTNNSSFTTNIEFLDSDNAGTGPTNYSGANSYFSSLKSAVSWGLSAWNSGTTYTSVSLAIPIQAIVERSGWTSGNAMALRLVGNYFGASYARSVASYDNTTYTEPRLTIEYLPYATNAIACLCYTGGYYSTDQGFMQLVGTPASPASGYVVTGQDTDNGGAFELREYPGGAVKQTGGFAGYVWGAITQDNKILLWMHDSSTIRPTDAPDFRVTPTNNIGYGKWSAGQLLSLENNAGFAYEDISSTQFSALDNAGVVNMDIYLYNSEADKILLTTDTTSHYQSYTTYYTPTERTGNGIGHYCIQFVVNTNNAYEEPHTYYVYTGWNDEEVLAATQWTIAFNMPPDGLLGMTVSGISWIAPGGTPTYYGSLKRYNGTTWSKEPIKYYTGAAWASGKPLKRYDGSQWRLIDTTGV